MSLDDRRVDADEKGELLRKLKLKLAILKNRKLGQWEAEESRAFHSYRWTFGSLDHSSASEELPILDIPKLNSNANADEHEDGFELQQYLPDVDNWPISKLRKLEVALSENQISISLLREEDARSNATASETTLNQPRNKLSRTYHRMKSHLFEAIKNKTGHNDIPWSNPLRSHPGPPYSFVWDFSPKYPAFPTTKGGVSRWNAEQFRECEEALKAGHLTIKGTAFDVPHQANLETNPSQLMHGNISNLRPSSFFSNLSTSDFTTNFTSKEADITQNHIENTQQAQLLNLTNEGGGVESQHNEPSGTCQRVLAASLSTRIGMLLEHALEEYAKELETFMNQRQLAKMEALEQEVRRAQLLIADLNVRMASDRQEAANLIQYARREGEVLGRERAMKDIAEDQDEALIALRKHHLRQIEKARKQSYQAGFEAGRTSNQGLVLQPSSLKEDTVERNPRSQGHGDNLSHALQASQPIHNEQHLSSQADSSTPTPNSNRQQESSVIYVTTNTEASVNRGTAFRVEDDDTSQAQNNTTEAFTNINSTTENIISLSQQRGECISLPTGVSEDVCQIETFIHSFPLPECPLPLDMKAFPLSFIQKHIGGSEHTFTNITAKMQRQQSVHWPKLIKINSSSTYETHERSPKFGTHGALTFVRGWERCGTIGTLYPVILEVDTDAYQYIGHYKVTSRNIMPIQSWYALSQLQRDKVVSSIRHNKKWGSHLLSSIGVNVDKINDPSYLLSLFENDQKPYLRMSWTILQFIKFDMRDYKTLLSKVAEDESIHEGLGSTAREPMPTSNQSIDSAPAIRMPVPISKDLYDLALPRWVEVSLANHQNSTESFHSLNLTPPERESLSDAIRQHAQSSGKLGKNYSTQRQIKTLKLYISGLALELSSTYYLGQVHNVAAVLKIFMALYQGFMYHSWFDELTGQVERDGGTAFGGEPIAAPPYRRLSEEQSSLKRSRPQSQSENEPSGTQKRKRQTTQGLPTNSLTEEATPSVQLSEKILSQSDYKDDLLPDNHSDLYYATPPPSRIDKAPQPN